MSTPAPEAQQGHHLLQRRQSSGDWRGASIHRSFGLLWLLLVRCCCRGRTSRTVLDYCWCCCCCRHELVAAGAATGGSSRSQPAPHGRRKTTAAWTFLPLLLSSRRRSALRQPPLACRSLARATLASHLLLVGGLHWRGIKSKGCRRQKRRGVRRCEKAGIWWPQIAKRVEILLTGSLRHTFAAPCDEGTTAMGKRMHGSRVEVMADRWWPRPNKYSSTASRAAAHVGRRQWAKKRQHTCKFPFADSAATPCGGGTTAAMGIRMHDSGVDVMTGRPRQNTWRLPLALSAAARAGRGAPAAGQSRQQARPERRRKVASRVHLSG